MLHLGGGGGEKPENMGLKVQAPKKVEMNTTLSVNYAPIF